MRLNFSILAASLVAISMANSAFATPVRERPSLVAKRLQEKANLQPRCEVSGGEAIDFNDVEGVKGRVKYLWTEVEKYRPVEHAAIESVYRDFGPEEYEMLPTGINDRPFQVDWRTTTQDDVKFPKGFSWGFSEASAQAEGGAKADGRGPSGWDFLSHRAGHMMLDNSTFDVATNFRYMYPLDIKRVAEMGAKMYSISISWSRVMPLGRGYVSEEGLQFYKDLIQEIHDNGMEAAVTLQHWDVPLYPLMNESQWMVQSYPDDFAEYSDAVIKALGPLGVKYWISHNEPLAYCSFVYQVMLQILYGYDSFPPEAHWHCASGVVKGHGRMNEVFRKHQEQGIVSKNAMISFKNAGSLNVPWNVTSEADKAAVERQMDFGIGLFANPIHSDTNDWAPALLEEVPKDWLVPLTPEDKQRLTNSADFMAIDYYSSAITQALTPEEEEACHGNVSHPAFPDCSNDMNLMADGWPAGEEFGDESKQSMPSTPGMLREHLKYCQERWPTEGGIVIAEFGWAGRDEKDKHDWHELMMDTGRQNFFKAHLTQLLQSIHEDGVKVFGAWLWSATSNIEWFDGFNSHFGLQNVNHSDPNLPRQYMASAYTIRDFFKKHLSDNDSVDDDECQH